MDFCRNLHMNQSPFENSKLALPCSSRSLVFLKAYKITFPLSYLVLIHKFKKKLHALRHPSLQYIPVYSWCIEFIWKQLDFGFIYEEKLNWESIELRLVWKSITYCMKINLLYGPWIFSSFSHVESQDSAQSVRNS